MLRELLPMIDGLQWIAATSAVSVFEGLIDQFAGPTELQRWSDVKSRLIVHDDALPQNRCVLAFALHTTGSWLNATARNLIYESTASPTTWIINKCSTKSRLIAYRPGRRRFARPPFFLPMSTRRLSSRTQRRVEVPMKQTLFSCTGPPVQCVHSVQRTQFAASGHVTGKQASWPVCRSPRIDALQHLDDRGKATFGLGDARCCPTVTANGRLLNQASSCGVSLVAVVHHTIWLTAT